MTVEDVVIVYAVMAGLVGAWCMYSDRVLATGLDLMVIGLVGGLFWPVALPKRAYKRLKWRNL